MPPWREFFFVLWKVICVWLFVSWFSLVHKVFFCICLWGGLLPGLVKSTQQWIENKKNVTRGGEPTLTAYAVQYRVNLASSIPRRGQISRFQVPIAYVGRGLNNLLVRSKLVSVPRFYYILNISVRWVGVTVLGTSIKSVFCIRCREGWLERCKCCEEQYF